jgi:hypothetical protein
MRWLIFILIIHSVNAIAQNPELRRICQDPDDNTIYWSNPSYFCNNFKFYIIWASDDGVNYFPVDTNHNINSESHVHVNANVSTITPNQYYFIERRDSCLYPFNHYSDTLEIDIENPASTFLDSVSVDINTNKVILGWKKNPLPDFLKYYLYKDNPYILINPSGTRDTFIIDETGSNPNLAPIEYDINTQDSCGNPSIFGINPHKTIHLTHTIDTCKLEVELSWTHYFGWNGIEKYHILKDTGDGIFIIDSVNGDISTYIDKIVLKGATYQYFVRAIKDTTILITSSSNKTSFTTRNRLDPTIVDLVYVTNSLTSQTIFINFEANNTIETKNYKLYASAPSINPFELTLNKNEIGQEINTGLPGDIKYQFTIEAINHCDIPTLQSNISTNIIIDSIPSPHRILVWNPYFTWNTGVEKYRVSRGTGENNNYTFEFWKEITDTFIDDTAYISDTQSFGVCYYIEAVKNIETGIRSKSNILCFSNPFTAFIPNAFKPDGVNNKFKPEGASIDYSKSTIEVYNRWGILIYSGFINEGWDGVDNAGQVCEAGVYIYKINTVSIKDETKQKSGIFTIIR